MTFENTLRAHLLISSPLIIFFGKNLNFGWNKENESKSDEFLVVGSPADKADLEVADEILEINGKALHNCSHTEVIAHIHNVGLLLIAP